MAKPVLVVVDDEDTSLQALTRELASRYGAHYQVMSGSSAEVALARLAELKAAGLMCRWCWPISGCRE
jgi:ActR/RegA family two-component response regulator